MQDWKVPALAIAIVRNDSVILSRGFGTRTLGTKRRWTIARSSRGPGSPRSPRCAPRSRLPSLSLSSRAQRGREERAAYADRPW
jgi:hypothetical protein